eukprot:471177-Rhodomonas_salina.2
MVQGHLGSCRGVVLSRVAFLLAGCFHCVLATEQKAADITAVEWSNLQPTNSAGARIAGTICAIADDIFSFGGNGNLTDDVLYTLRFAIGVMPVLYERDSEREQEPASERAN